MALVTRGTAKDGRIRITPTLDDSQGGPISVVIRGGYRVSIENMYDYGYWWIEVRKISDNTYVGYVDSLEANYPTFDFEMVGSTINVIDVAAGGPVLTVTDSSVTTAGVWQSDPDYCDFISFTNLDASTPPTLSATLAVSDNGSITSLALPVVPATVSLATAEAISVDAAATIEFDTDIALSDYAGIDLTANVLIPATLSFEDDGTATVSARMFAYDLDYRLVNGRVFASLTGASETSVSTNVLIPMGVSYVDGSLIDVNAGTSITLAVSAAFDSSGSLSVSAASVLPASVLPSGSGLATTNPNITLPADVSLVEDSYASVAAELAEKPDLDVILAIPKIAWLYNGDTGFGVMLGDVEISKLS